MTKSREWNAAEYQRLSNPQFGWGMAVLEQLALRGDEAVLDGGCGAGRVTVELVARLPHGRVVALDLSRNMASTAAAALSSSASRVVVGNADLLALPLPAASLDIVFSTATFHWIRDHDRLFAELFRVLRPGGLLHAQCGGGPNLVKLRRRATAIAQSPRYAPFFEEWHEPWEYPDDALTADRLRRAGFVNVRTWLHAEPTRLANAREFQDFQATVTMQRHLARIPETDLRAGFLAALAEQFSNDDPPFTLDYWRLNIRATKPAL